jgi:hypothetical protein
MGSGIKLILVISLAVLLLPSCLILFVQAQDEGFHLEAEQNWDTYQVGGTCIFGTHNIFVADADDDGVMEIITGGFTYNAENRIRISSSQAPLKVWSWNGQNVTLEASAKWDGLILGLYAADVDADNVMEIITAGTSRNASSNYGSIRIWHLSNGELTLQAHNEGGSVGGSLFVCDADTDGVQEILSLGRTQNEISNVTQLRLWDFRDNTLTLDKTVNLDSANLTSANSVCAADLDNDGLQEVIIGGYSDTLSNSKGQVTIWQWNGTAFAIKANENWQTGGGTAKTIAGGTMGNTVVNNVKAADLDGDGFAEIVTAGFTYDGEDVNGQIKVWGWDGSALTEKASQEWVTDYLTEAKCITLNDVDADGKIEIVQSGIAAAQGSFNNSEAAHDRAQLRVWGLADGVLTLELGKDWTFDDGACAWNVASGDVDKDGVVELITVGCSALGGLCDPDMRIWSLSDEQRAVDYVDYLPYVAGAMLLAIGISSLVYLLKKKYG